MVVFSLCQSGFAPREAWMSAVQATQTAFHMGKGNCAAEPAHQAAAEPVPAHTRRHGVENGNRCRSRRLMP